MTVLVFGTSGQLACELQRAAPELTFLGRGEADLSLAGEAAAAISRHAPSAVINAAAWTAVDAAEEQRDAAFAVNHAAVKEMAREAAERAIPLVHVSTDYVFDGSGHRAWLPDDPVAPLGVYGQSKLAGEAAIREAGCSHVILRTAWVFSAHGSNFVKSMLRLAESRDRLTIVVDQFGGPTPARDLAQACLKVLEKVKNDTTVGGTFHFSGAPDVSWADFAREIFAQAGQNVDVADIPSSSYPTPAQRPANSRLDCDTTHAVFGLERPDWKAGLRDVLEELAHEAIR